MTQKKDASKKDLLDALDSVRKSAVEQFAESNPDRIAQLDSALTTAEMAVEHLHTETPYRMGA